MERWPWLWILLPLCSAGIVSFSHFATTTFDSPLIAVASTPIFIGLLGGAAPAGSGLVRYELLQCEMRELEGQLSHSEVQRHAMAVAANEAMAAELARLAADL